MILYQQSGDRLSVSTEESTVRFLLITGRPIGEPVAWYGPIVMNTREELVRAFDEYDRGTFIKNRRPEPAESGRETAGKDGPI